jgi:uncharacterized Fe-S cluster protein YjdI
MIKKIHIGLGALLLAVPLFIAACGNDDNNGVTAGAAAAPGAATWVVPDNTISGNVVTIFNGAIDNLYYNVHSAAHSGGEIRGQLDASGAVRLATLTGLQEVPQVITPAFGAGVLVVDNVTNQVRGFIRTSGLTGTPTGAHIHNAVRGVPGPIILSLTGGPDLWVVPDNAVVDNVIAVYNAAPDNLYFNVHTTTNPNGEIRGQLDAEGFVRLATLNGAQDNVVTAALGGGMLIVDNSVTNLTDNNSVRGFVVSSGLTGTAAHIHNAARGTAGDNIVTLIGGPNLWIVPDERISAELVAIFNVAPDNLYFNVHTATNPSGAIRGQLDASGEILFATLNGAQDNVTTAAFGGGVLSIDTITNRVGGFLMSSGVAGTAAHVHNAARGTAGPIILPLLPAP